MNSPTPTESIPRWFIHLGGSPEGPIVFEEIEKRFQDGRATPETKVWHEGWENWRSASEVEMLASVLAPSSLTPPDNQQIVWWLVQDDEPAGPFFTQAILSKISTGEVDNSRWLTRNGWEEWKPITEASEFRHLFHAGVPLAVGRPAAVSMVAWRKLKWVGGCVAGLFVLLWMFSDGGNPPSGKQNPEEAFMEIARQGEQRIRDADGKPCRLCRGSGRTGKLDGCPDCKNPTSFDRVQKGLGTRTTPSGYVVVCTTCNGKGLVPELCSGCGGSGVFRR